MSIYLKIGRSQFGRDFVVGDIHGHLHQLDKQLQEVAFDPSCDRLFCLGDLIDRGPHSESLLSLIDKQTYFSVLGNHEAMMIAGHENPETAPRHKSNGGEWFYKLRAEERQYLVNRIRHWPWAIELDTGDQRIGLIHANALNNS
ncbi:metallophosphoesterase [Microbulbifer sp. VAAC004]|uniref:metallophosphoesterase n=1 Tax=unclassified Microbulbifer TaxID=2619833 RepID=UPI0040393914